jgi:hypothetical protein
MRPSFYTWLVSFCDDPSHLGDLAKTVLLEPSLTCWSSREDIARAFRDAPRILHDTLELAWDFYIRDRGIVISAAGCSDYFRHYMLNEDATT